MEHAEKNFINAVRELEKLNETYTSKEIPEEFAGNIKSAINEIRLWSISRQAGEFLRFITLSNKPKTILELGTSAGYSTLWIAAASRNYGGKVYTIELDKSKIAMAKKYFKKAGLDKHITILEGNISDVLRNWKKKIDFLFLDADKENYLSYLKQLEPFLTKGSVIIADDANERKKDLQNYLNYVSKNEKYSSFLLGIDHGLMLSVRL